MAKASRTTVSNADVVAEEVVTRADGRRDNVTNPEPETIAPVDWADPEKVLRREDVRRRRENAAAPLEGERVADSDSAKDGEQGKAMEEGEQSSRGASSSPSSRSGESNTEKKQTASRSSARTTANRS